MIDEAEAAAMNLGLMEAGDANMVVIAVAELAGCIADLKNDWLTLDRIYSRKKRERMKIEWVAVDATLELLSIVIMTEDGEILRWPNARPAPRAAVIDEAEAAAMNWGLTEAGDANMVVIAGDNTSVSRAFWKGYSLCRYDRKTHEKGIPRASCDFR